MDADAGSSWDPQRCARELVRCLRPSPDEPPLPSLPLPDIEKLLGFSISLTNGGPGQGPQYPDAAAVKSAMTRLDCWRQCFERVAHEPHDQALGDGLLSFWMAYGLCSVPCGLKDDIAVFADALRRHLPPYRGPGMTLYRGQLESRNLAGVYGIAWTSRRRVARDFAARQASLEQQQSVVLRIDAEPGRIVAPPTEGSLWMDEHEYIIDPRGIQAVVVATIPAQSNPP